MVPYFKILSPIPNWTNEAHCENLYLKSQDSEGSCMKIDKSNIEDKQKGLSQSAKTFLFLMYCIGCSLIYFPIWGILSIDVLNRRLF